MQVAFGFDRLNSVVLALDSLPSEASKQRGCRLAARAAEFVALTTPELLSKACTSFLLQPLFGAAATLHSLLMSTAWQAKFLRQPIENYAGVHACVKLH